MQNNTLPETKLNTDNFEEDIIEQMRIETENDKFIIPQLKRQVEWGLYSLIGFSLVQNYKDLRNKDVTYDEYKRRTKRLEWSIQTFGGNR